MRWVPGAGEVGEQLPYLEFSDFYLPSYCKHLYFLERWLLTPGVYRALTAAPDVTKGPHYIFSMCNATIGRLKTADLLEGAVRNCSHDTGLVEDML